MFRYGGILAGKRRLDAMNRHVDSDRGRRHLQQFQCVGSQRSWSNFVHEEIPQIAIGEINRRGLGLSRNATQRTESRGQEVSRVVPTDSLLRPAVREKIVRENSVR